MNMKEFPLRDILVVGIPVLFFLALLYTLKSHFPDVVNVIGTLFVIIVNFSLCNIFISETIGIDIPYKCKS